MNNHRNFHGWHMVAVLWVLYFINMGFPWYGGTVIVNAMRDNDIPMDGMTYGIGFSMVSLFVGLGGIPAGLAVIRYGIRMTFVMGSVLLVAGSLLLACFATQRWHYLVGFGFLVGMGMALGTTIPLATTITRWFVRFRGRAMGLALTASGFAGFAAAPAINKFIAVSNWRLAWLVVAAVCVASAVIAFLLIKERPQDYGEVPDGREATEAEKAAAGANPLVTKYAWTPAEVYRTGAYWITVLVAACSQWPYFFFTAHWIPHLKDRGIVADERAFAMGLFTMGGIIGRLISGWLMDRIAARYAFMLGLCCYFVGSFLALQADPSAPAAVYLAAICYGAAFGWCLVAQQTMLGNFFGPAAFPKINGSLMAIAAVLVCASATIGGKMHDIFESYAPAFYLNVAVGVAGIVLLVFATMPRSPASADAAALETSETAGEIGS
jgi:MFS family permease